MKKLKWLVLLIFLFPISVFADTEMVLVNCPNKIKADKEFTCTITATSEYDVYSVEMEYVLPDYIEQVNSTVSADWQGSNINNKFYVYTNVPKKVSFDIGTLTLKSNKDLESLNINVVELIYSDSDFQDHIIIKKDNVNNVVNESKKEVEKKNNNFKYVIIIMIIGAIVVVILTYYIRSGKNEK